MKEKTIKPIKKTIVANVEPIAIVPGRDGQPDKIFYTMAEVEANSSRTRIKRFIDDYTNVTPIDWRAMVDELEQIRHPKRK